MRIPTQEIRLSIIARRKFAFALMLVIGAGAYVLASSATITALNAARLESINSNYSTSTLTRGPQLNDKVSAWELGNKLSLAALLYDMNGTENSDSMKTAKALAAKMDAQVPPLPPKTGTKAKDSAAIIYYLLNDAGKSIIGKIKEKHGPEHGQLFEMSLKSNLLLMLYGPGEKDALAISGVIKRNGARLNLPAALWQPVVDKVEAAAPYGQVKDAVFKMQQDVGRYLATQG